MPIYDFEIEKPKAINFAKHLRIPSGTPMIQHWSNRIHPGDLVDEEDLELAAEMDEMLEEEFDEAAVPVY